MPRRKAKSTRPTRGRPYDPPAAQHSQRETGHLTGLSTEREIQSVSNESSALAQQLQYARRPFRRRGTFAFLALPLEIRQMIYHLLLVPIGDKLVTLHFGHFMPGLGSPRYSQNILRVCRGIRHEALALLYSGAVYVRGFDLMDFSSSLRLSHHPWLRDEVRPIKSLRVRFSLLAREAEFSGHSEVFLRTLPECKVLKIDLLGEEDWANAREKGFVDFVRSLRLEGLDVELRGLSKSGPDDSSKNALSLTKTP